MTFLIFVLQLKLVPNNMCRSIYNNYSSLFFLLFFGSFKLYSYTSHAIKEGIVSLILDACPILKCLKYYQKVPLFR